MALRLPLDTINQTQGFGDRPAYYKQFGQLGHNGYDFACGVGTPVKAAEAGTVVFEGVGMVGAGGYRGWVGKEAGVICMIKHSNCITNYAHLNSTIVNNGQTVAKGQVIGYSGVTGVVQGAHLHWEVFPFAPDFKNGYAGRINPAPFINTTTPPTGGGNNMADKVTADAWRQLSHGILGANGVAGRRTTLDGSRDGEGHIGRDLTVGYLSELFLSPEARQWRDSGDANSINGINARLESIPVLTKEKNDAVTAKDNAIKERDAARKEVEKLKAELAAGGGSEVPSGDFKKVLSSGQDLYIKE